jgi:hypothetical protein
MDHPSTVRVLSKTGVAVGDWDRSEAGLNLAWP